jgi:plasmid maintenance system antidote protein VapI
MDTSVTPTRLAEALGISVPYASQILNGTRTRCSSEIALAAFRTFGLKLGLLADMTDDDVAKLCAQQCHAASDSETEAAPSSGKSGDVTASVAA